MLNTPNVGLGCWFFVSPLKRKEPAFTGSQGDKVFHAFTPRRSEALQSQHTNIRATQASQLAGPLCQPIADDALTDC